MPCIVPRAVENVESKRGSRSSRRFDFAAAFALVVLAGPAGCSQGWTALPLSEVRPLAVLGVEIVGYELICTRDGTPQPTCPLTGLDLEALLERSGLFEGVRPGRVGTRYQLGFVLDISNPGYWWRFLISLGTLAIIPVPIRHDYTLSAHVLERGVEAEERPEEPTLQARLRALGFEGGGPALLEIPEGFGLIRHDVYDNRLTTVGSLVLPIGLPLFVDTPAERLPPLVVEDLFSRWLRDLDQHRVLAIPLRGRPRR